MKTLRSVLSISIISQDKERDEQVALDHMEQDKSECGLSKMLNILYSKFCAGTVLSSTRSKIKHHYEAVQ